FNDGNMSVICPTCQMRRGTFLRSPAAQHHWWKRGLMKREKNHRRRRSSTRRLRVLQCSVRLMHGVRDDWHRAVRFRDRLGKQRELIVGQVVIGLAAFLFPLLPPHLDDADL